MSIDERIAELKGKHDILTERHNALVESIELMILENREQDAKWKEHEEQRDKRLGQLDTRLDKLLQIAQFHQHRLDSHNDRLDQLEEGA